MSSLLRELLMNQPGRAPVPPTSIIGSLTILCETEIMISLRPRLAPYDADTFYTMRDYYLSLHLGQTYKRIRERLQFARENAHTYINTAEEPEYHYFNEFLICEIGEFVVTLRDSPYEEWIEVLENKLHDFFINAMDSLMSVAYQVPREGRFHISSFLTPLMDTMDDDQKPEFKLRLVQKCNEIRLNNPDRYVHDHWGWQDVPEVIINYPFDFLVYIFINSYINRAGHFNLEIDFIRSRNCTEDFFRLTNM